MDWKLENNFQIKAFEFEDNREKFFACIGTFNPSDTECLGLFHHKENAALQDILTRDNYLGKIETHGERINVADLIEIIGRRDLYLRTRPPVAQE